MKKSIYIILTLLIILILLNIIFPVTSFAIGSTKLIGANDIASLLEGKGIKISNVKIKGYAEQLGYVTGTSYIPGFENFDEGVILSTGSVNGIFGPEHKTKLDESFYKRANYKKNGDADLEEELKEYGFNSYVDDTDKTWDAMSIEFDAVSESSFISIQYIFASEEFDQAYLFNDIFALFINGKNIAKIPNTNTSVSMVALRDDYSQYFYDNCCNEDEEGFGYCGYSSLLSCQTTVTPGQTNKVKLVVADVKDQMYDTAILIKEHSVSSEEAPEPEVNPNSDTDPDPNPSPNPSPTPNPTPNPDPDPTPTPNPKPVENPKPQIEIDKEVSTVKLMTADGRIINYIELEDGKNVNDLKSAFIADNIYLIVDNEMIQGAIIEIEYKIKVKSKLNMICTELLIEDYLDGGLVCTSTDWKYDENGNLKLQLSGDLSNPIIEPHGQFETTIIASRQLTSFSIDYEFKNKAKAIVNINEVQLTSEEAEAQTVNIISPSGNTKHHILINILGILSIALIIISFVKCIYIIRKKKV